MGIGLGNFTAISRVLRLDQVIAVLMILVPVNIFISSQFSGFTAQFPFFRFEWTSSGYSLVPITQDLNFVTFWLILWIFGDGILISGIILSFLETANIRRSFKRTAMIIAAAGVFFLLSIIIHYNVLFYKQEIMMIPLGIPVMLLLSGWIYRESRKQSPVTSPGI
jgi:hypothetical protein